MDSRPALASVSLQSLRGAQRQAETLWFCVTLSVRCLYADAKTGPGKRRRGAGAKDKRYDRMINC